MNLDDWKIQDPGPAREYVQTFYSWQRQIRECVDYESPDLDENQAIQCLLREIGKILDCDRCFLIKLDGENALPIEHEYLKDYSVPSFLGAMPPWNRCPILGMNAEKKYEYAEDSFNDPRISTDPFLHNLFKSKRIGAGIGCPVVYHDQLMSVLVVHHSTPRKWTTEEHSLVMAASDQIALALVLCSKRRSEAENKLIEEALLESEKRFSAIFSQAAVGISVVDQDRRFVKVNQKYCDIVGYSAEELYNLTIHDITHPDDVESAGANASRLFNGTLPTYTLEKRYVRKDGSVVWVSLSTSIITDADGNPKYGIGVVQDITVHKENEARLRRVVDSDIIGIVFWDKEQGRITDANNAFLQMVGYTKEEMLGDKVNWKEMTPREYWHLDEKAFAEMDVHPNGKCEPYEKQYIAKDGRRIDILLAVAYYEGRQDSGVAYIFDITDRKNAERALLESEERFRTMADASPHMVWRLDASGKLTYANKRILEFTSQTYDEVIENGWAEYVHPDDLQMMVENLIMAIQQKGFLDAEYRCKRADGEYRWLYAAGNPILGSQGELLGFVGTTMDITERKQMEEILRTSEERFQMINLATHDAIWDWDLVNQKAYWNESTQIMFNITAEEIGNDPSFWFDNIHPEDFERVSSNIHQAIESGAESWSDEYRFRCGDGNYKTVIDRGFIQRDESGKPIRMVGSMIDLTERIESEKRLQEYAKQLEQSNKELEQFALVASHDLQEPLRKVMLFSQYLQRAEDCKLTPEAKDYINRMQNATQRMQHLITDLLSLSRINRKGQPFKKTDLNNILDDVLSDLNYKINDTGGKVEVDQLCTVDADPIQMHQLFLNLIGNSLKFHRPDTPPFIKVHYRKLDEHFCQVVVEDNGIGFDEKYADQIFGIFERLHGQDQYEGTGIGLAICKKIIERHGGAITVRSAIGEGSSFMVALPYTPSDSLKSPDRLTTQEEFP